MKLQRIHEIEDYINQHKTVTLKEICDTFQISMNTVRRDIRYLEENGAIKKVYGGVTSTKGKQLTSFDFRTQKHEKAKKAIAEKAAKLVQANDYIFIDSGTTTRHMIEFLKEIPLTIFTNNVDIIETAIWMENIRLIIVGEQFDRKTRSFVSLNPNTDNLKGYNINKAFMAATGISLKNGITNSDPLEASIKRQLTQNAEEVFLLADQSKFGKVSLMTYSNLEQIDTIISDAPLSKDYADFCNIHSIRVL